MKKLILSLVLVATIALAGCSGSDYKDINQRIESRTELTQDDYKAMIEYLADVKKEYPEISSPEDFGKIQEKYPYFANFLSALIDAQISGKLDDQNIGRVNELSE